MKPAGAKPKFAAIEVTKPEREAMERHLHALEIDPQEDTRNYKEFLADQEACWGILRKLMAALTVALVVTSCASKVTPPNPQQFAPVGPPSLPRPSTNVVVMKQLAAVARVVATNVPSPYRLLPVMILPANASNYWWYAQQGPTPFGPWSFTQPIEAIDCGSADFSNTNFPGVCTSLQSATNGSGFWRLIGLPMPYATGTAGP